MYFKIHEDTLFGSRLGLSADSSCSELMDIAYAGITIEYTKGAVPFSTIFEAQASLIQATAMDIDGRWLYSSVSERSVGRDNKRAKSLCCAMSGS
ncbi:unnamed protein product [Gongylonema pulchrum]|uniref:DOMON domain-containing protein n=1 Tax=Gongylonema pulchrum TaxID=637853 RepID=A0A183DJN5_9BILA|nr:unnamed protein product [Gongylonema pulchrum]